MMHTIIRHKVKDYDKWKSAFDGHSPIRKAGGEKGGHLFRNKTDSNEIFIELKWDTMENAQKFYESEDLKNVMKKAGITDKPDIYFLEEVEQVL